MALNFPNSPTNGQVYLDVSTGNRWAWDSANTCWKSTSAFTQSITIAASAPGEPVIGQLWWNQDYGRLLVYYNDGTSSQWVDASPSDYTSTQAFNQSNNAYSISNTAFNMANASYTSSNLAYVAANAAIPAFNTANAAFGKANNALANTSGTFAGNMTVTGSVTTTNVSLTNISNATGSLVMVNGYSRQPGTIIEYLSNPCDGTTLNSINGAITWPSVSTWSLSYSFVDNPGSSVTYTPPSWATKVIYRYEFATWWQSAHAISSHTFYIDGVEVVYARHSRSGYYHEYRGAFEWAIGIGGTPNTNTGRIASWTTPKVLKMQWMSYGGSDQMYLHGTTYWNGGGGTYFSMPTLTLIAIA